MPQAPAENDETSHCIHCGRDNQDYEGQPCIDECPQYWEAAGKIWPDNAKEEQNA